MKTPTRMLATLSLALIAAFTAACERTTSTPPAPTTFNNDGSRLNAPPAPSLAGTPIDPVPETHAAAVPPPAPSEPTARDTPANEPAATLAEPKEKTEMPLAGQVNNHSSDAFQAGRNESPAPERSDKDTGRAETPTDAPKPQS
jgi:hypothetical protein